MDRTVSEMAEMAVALTCGGMKVCTSPRPDTFDVCKSPVDT